MVFVPGFFIILLVLFIKRDHFKLFVQRILVISKKTLSPWPRHLKDTFLSFLRKLGGQRGLAQPGLGMETGDLWGHRGAGSVAHLP